MNFVKPTLNNPKEFYLDGKKSITYGNFIVSEYNNSYYGIYRAEDYYKKELLSCQRSWSEAIDYAYNLQLAYEEGFSSANNIWIDGLYGSFNN